MDWAIVPFGLGVAWLILREPSMRSVRTVAFIVLCNVASLVIATAAPTWSVASPITVVPLVAYGLGALALAALPLALTIEFEAWFTVSSPARQHAGPPTDREIGFFFVAIGVGSLISALLRLGNPGVFPPSDPRSQPGYTDSVVQVMVAIALLSLLFGLVYLYRHRGR